MYFPIANCLRVGDMTAAELQIVASSFEMLGRRPLISTSNGSISQDGSRAKPE
jgi:hypothetical protein